VTGPRHHLAQVNVARLRAPLDDPLLAGFVALLEPLNALADASRGFVWRLQTEAGDATALRVFDDDRVLINLSVWESLEALTEFVYSSRHLDALRRRREWFQRLAEASLALWWLPAGDLPDVGEAARRLERLRAHGPTPAAFTFRQPFPPPAQPLNTTRRPRGSSIEPPGGRVEDSGRSTGSGTKALLPSSSTVRSTENDFPSDGTEMRSTATGRWVDALKYTTSAE
jgi:hypothetical protein